MRRATRGDLEALVAFNAAMARETEGKALDLGRLRAGAEAVLGDARRGFYLVAETAGQVVGQLLVTAEWSDWRNAYFWWVQSVYVSPDYRRRGVYRALDSHIRAEARRRGDICGVRLYVERANRVARQAYTSLGMTRSRYDLYEIDLDG